MTIDDIRKLAAEERAHADRSRNDPWAESHARVLLCDAVDALLAVVDALPRCSYGESFGHGALGTAPQCASPATKRNRFETACDHHAAQFKELRFVDLPYADALRALLAKDLAR